MEQSEGFIDPNHPDHVCKLIKGLYGLKQTGWEWNEVIHKYLLELGFIQNSADACLYSCYLSW